MTGMDWGGGEGTHAPENNFKIGATKGEMVGQICAPKIWRKIMQGTLLRQKKSFMYWKCQVTNCCWLVLQCKQKSTFKTVGYSPLATLSVPFSALPLLLALPAPTMAICSPDISLGIFFIHHFPLLETGEKLHVLRTSGDFCCFLMPQCWHKNDFFFLSGRAQQPHYWYPILSYHHSLGTFIHHFSLWNRRKAAPTMTFYTLHLDDNIVNYAISFKTKFAKMTETTLTMSSKEKA